jgi:hypothetical protein
MPVSAWRDLDETGGSKQRSKRADERFSRVIIYKQSSGSPLPKLLHDVPYQTTR